MSRFNTRTAQPVATSPVTTTGQTTVNHQGGTGHLRDAKSELFLLAVSNTVSNDTFYEKAGTRDDRYQRLVRKLAADDPEWTASLLRWLRTDANMRTAALVGAAEFTAERILRQLPGHSRQVIASVLQRPDEPGELLAYWTSHYGRNIPKPVKRGIEDAIGQLYTEKALLKYDTASKGFRFGDVLELVHPSPRALWQGDLFKHALDRRHNRDNSIPESLTMLHARAFLAAMPVSDRRAYLDTTGAQLSLREAGMTWEALAGWLQGPLDAAAWTAVIPSMGYMALLRNLRNFDQAGVPDDVAASVAATLADPAAVAKSRQFPFRFLAAYKNAPSLRWGHALEKALGYSLANVPALPGRTLVLVDRSGSMFGGISERTQLNRADSAAVFGTALAMRAESSDLIEFGSTSQHVTYRAGESVLPVIGRFHDLGGTATAAAVRAHYRAHDRVVIVTDEQTGPSNWGGNPLDAIPASVPVYTWNLAGYHSGHAPTGTANRHTFGGLTDQAFGLIPLLEAGRSAAWPWEHKAA
ncbi:TROVE domain-containing protein [Kitasatospora sp. NBC_00240]|uniref:TROVE domain-containing protein n=1 Tax=Kitasatospora sp. NBC_00240 TaxID=2903567 RepID=UPI00224EA7B4|nr:TROVE domain-containing protein [Kitasatospora sp. NBC_00240]MCX5209800.1 TROVE domain-containing protein [Kitasatospora sp. NBC_00240]